MKKRIALAFTLLTAACVAALTWLAYSNSKAALSDAVLRDTRSALAASVLRIRQTLNSVGKDVLILNSLPPMRGVLRALRAGGYDAEAQSTYAMWVERYQQTLVSLLRAKPDYWQARYLDEHGQERVRVDNLDGSLQIVPESGLQNKAEYPYFTETLQLPPGGLYISALNLNREHGRIQTPYRPTLRVATPVFDAQNVRKGVIVINLHAGELLKTFLDPLKDLGGQSYLVNQDGYFLAHPDPDKTFGFDLDRDERLQHTHPRLAARLGDVETFVEIVDRDETAGAGAHVHGFRKIIYDPLNPQNYWAAVFEVPNTVALAPVAQQRNLLLGVGLAITLVGTWAGFVWADRITRPLDELSAIASHIAGGHPEHRVELVGKRDEIRALAASFNHMVDALVASERRLTNILDTAGDAIISIDEEQRIVAYNRAAQEIFGHPAQAVLGRPLDLLLPTDLAAAHRGHIHAFDREPALTRVMGGGREVAGRRADGTLFPAEASISKIIEGGHAVYTAILRDVTERKRAEAEVHALNAELEQRVAVRTAELRENEARFQAVADTATEAVITADSRGDIIYFNPSAQRIFGYSAQEAIGQPLTRLMPARFHAAHQQGLRRFLASGEAHAIGTTVELAGRRKDGVEFPLELSLASWKTGESTFFAGMARDITQRKLAEDSIRELNRGLERRSTELEAANKELEAFSYSVSHDLRAPLRSIDGFSQALLEDYQDKLDAVGRSHLQRVRAASQRMAILIDDMLGLSRVTRAPMQRETVDLSALAQSVVDELRQAHPQHDAEVTITPALTTAGDARLLRILLANLLANAWKFTGKTGTARIEFGAVQQDGALVFYVRDNGVGFDMQYAHKLFGAFQRLHALDEFPGTGIGLATVQRIVHRHGGSVRAEGQPGVGATFYFTLPQPDAGGAL